MRILTVVGARPQFVKAAPLARALAARPGVDHRLIHTGQHYDDALSDLFFRELQIPPPARNLGIGSGSHGAQTGRMLEAVEAAFLQDRPDRVVVYGDTNSTLAGALAAVKLHIPVAHVEAGLRSFNRRMPEEINRVLTDHASDLLFAPTSAAVDNLRREGLPEARIRRTGDVMYDAALQFGRAAEGRLGLLDRLGLAPRAYVLATVHRAENTDDPARLAGVLDGLGRLAARFPVVWPVHPRTRAALAARGTALPAGVRAVDPVGYLDMILLETKARAIVTDSGGVQKEAFMYGVPCLTLRDETEWVETLEGGANVLVGADPRRLTDAFDRLPAAGALRADPARHYGDGRASERIAEALAGA